MAWNSTLKRRTPLKARTPLRVKKPMKPGAGFNRPHGRGKTEVDETSDCVAKSPQKAKERAKTARRQTRSSLETHLDIVFSLYIRLRDAMEGGLCRCISCGRVFPFENIQCGHFFGRSNRSTRWDESNCNAECVGCNCYDSGHLEGYAKNLIAKIGKERYDDLCRRAKATRKWSGDELRDMIRRYTAEVKRLSGEKGINARI